MAQISEVDANLTSFNDEKLAGLYLALKKLDIAIDAVNKASMFDAADKGKIAINQTRELLGAVVLAVHTLRNEVRALKVGL